MTALTHEEFAVAMQSIADKFKNDDPEAAHGRADDLLCRTLRELGYGAGIDIYDKLHKWYA